MEGCECTDLEGPQKKHLRIFEATSDLGRTTAQVPNLRTEATLRPGTASAQSNEITSTLASSSASSTLASPLASAAIPTCGTRIR